MAKIIRHLSPRGKQSVDINIVITDNNGIAEFITPTNITLQNLNLTHSDALKGVNGSANKIKLSGKVKSNTSSSIARIRIIAPEADTGNNQLEKYFKNKPYIQTRSKFLKLKLISLERSLVSKEYKVKSYIFDLIYNGTSSLANSINVDLIYNLEDIVYKTKQIDNIYFGNEAINPQGETREIIITGTPGAEFGLAVNERFVEYDEANVPFFNKINDTSILDYKTKNDKATYDYGKEIDIINGIIGKNGKFRFLQKFPSIFVQKTTMIATADGGATTTKKAFKNTNNIRVNDRLTYKSIAQNPTKYTVTHVNPDGDNENELTVSSALTSISNGDPVSFSRSRFYSIDIIPEWTEKLKRITSRSETSRLTSEALKTTSTLSSGVPTKSPTYILSQLAPTRVTLRHSTAGVAWTFTHQNNVATGLSAGAEYDVVLEGPAGRSYGLYKGKRGFKTSFKVALTVQESSGGKTITSFKKPIFNKYGKSSWSNSNSTSNGGTIVEIKNIIVALGASSSVARFFYDIDIKQFGNRDITIELDTDRLISLSS